MRDSLRSIASAALVALSASACLAQPDTTIYPACNGKFGLCGYIDRQTWLPLIPPRFERAMYFSEGLAAVRIDGRYGYIDRRGEMVIAPRFDLAGEFSQGLAEVIVGNKAGVINRAGDLVVPPIFGRAVPFTRDVVIAAEGSWRSSSNAAGFETLNNLNYSGSDLYNVGLYRVGGSWIRPPNLARVRVFALDGRGLIWAAERDLFGLLASDGRWVVEPQYDFGAQLADGLAVVRKRIGAVPHSGAVDETGALVVPLKRWSLFFGKYGWLRAQEAESGGRQGFVNRNGDLVGGRWFDKVDSADQADPPLVLADGKLMGLDRSGTLVPHPWNGRVFASCPFGVRIVYIDGKSQIVNVDGHPTIPHLFDPVVSAPNCTDPFPVRLGGKWGFVGLDGQLLHDPPAFDSAHYFANGHAFVLQNRKWGIIDRTGRMVVAPMYDARLEARGGLTRVSAQGREFWITASGEERAEPPQTYPRRPEMLSCGHGVQLVERDGNWGIADGGRDLIPPRYRAVSCYGSGFAWVAVDARRQWCPFGPDGRMRDKPACTDAHYITTQSHSVPEQFSTDRYENSVLWSRAYLEFHAGKRDIPPGWTGDGGRGGSSTVINR